MTRAEDVWSQPRGERTTTLRYGIITAVPSPGFANITVVGGSPVLVGVPVFGGASTVGISVLVLHDGAKVVAIAGN